MKKNSTQHMEFQKKKNDNTPMIIENKIQEQFQINKKVREPVSKNLIHEFNQIADDIRQPLINQQQQPNIINKQVIFKEDNIGNNYVIEKIKLPKQIIVMRSIPIHGSKYNGVIKNNLLSDQQCADAMNLDESILFVKNGKDAFFYLPYWHADHYIDGIVEDLQRNALWTIKEFDDRKAFEFHPHLHNSSRRFITYLHLEKKNTQNMRGNLNKKISRKIKTRILLLNAIIGSVLNLTNSSHIKQLVRLSIKRKKKIKKLLTHSICMFVPIHLHTAKKKA